MSEPVNDFLILLADSFLNYTLLDIFERHDQLRSDMKVISTLLSIAERPTADLLTIAENQFSGTCNWLTDHSTFGAWYTKHINRTAIYIRGAENRRSTD